MNIELDNIIEPLLKWYQREKRDLPWRHTADSYKIWISEIMLQQTRVEAVTGYYNRFIKELPTIKDLANAQEDKLLKLWEGLGYYSRARNLQKCAKELIKDKQKELPKDFNALQKLPGIGPYTAASIGSIAYGLKTPAIDGNVLRVMTRIHEDERDITMSEVRKEYFAKLSKVMPKNTRDFTEGLMELGALVCLPNGLPDCQKCPLSFLCQSYKHQSMLDYPKKKKEKPRKIEEKTILILEWNKKFALQKRPNKGLLASLYEFPNAIKKLSEKEVQAYLKKQNICFDKMKNMGSCKHVFSHLEWHMIGFHIICKEKPKQNLLWVTKEELANKYSLPVALSYYAKKLKECK